MYTFVAGNRFGDKVDIYPIVYAEKRKRGVGSVSADDEKKAGKRGKQGRPIGEEAGGIANPVFVQGT